MRGLGDVGKTISPWAAEHCICLAADSANAFVFNQAYGGRIAAYRVPVRAARPYGRVAPIGDMAAEADGARSLVG